MQLPSTTRRKRLYITLIQCDFCDQFNETATLHQVRADADTWLICEDCRQATGIEGEPHSAAELATIEALASGGIWQNVINIGSL